MTNKIKKIAFIGAGYMAEEHLKVFCTLKDINLVGIVSKTREKSVILAKKFNIGNIFIDIESLYKETKPDIVIIAVPEMACKSVCEKSFIYPWTILIEKPVGYNINEARYLNSLAKKHNTKVYVALNRRHYASTRFVLDDINLNDSKRIVSIIDQEDTIAAEKSGQPFPVIRNWMYANSIHLIDYFNIFCRGKLIEIETPSQPNKEMNEPVVSFLKYESGDIGIYQCQWNGPGPWSVSISNKFRRYEMRPLEKLSIQNIDSRKAILQVLGNEDEIFKPGLLIQSKELIKSSFDICNSLPTISDALESMELINKIYE